MIYETRLALLDGPVELGVRSLHLLLAAYPHPLSLQSLVNCDYVLTHSDDVEGGPPGLHPKTPLRSGEILAKRTVLQQGLDLMMSRGLAEKVYRNDGVYFAVSEETASFIDALVSPYHKEVEARSVWIMTEFPPENPGIMDQFIRANIDTWGAEFNLALWHGEVSP